jgi:G3E family GTPase
MKIAQIAGFLGSGKTTLLIEVAKLLVERGKKVAIVVNDVGEINVDFKIIEAYGLKARELSGGCICCEIAGNFANTLSLLYSNFNPDIVIVEPSGVAIPWGLKRAAEYSEAEVPVTIEHAPVLTLVDATRIDTLMGTVRRLVVTQVREADVCLVNKVDAAQEEGIARAEELIRSVNPNCEIMRISTHQNKGVKEVADIIVDRTSSRYDEAMERALLEKEYGSG